MSELDIQANGRLEGGIQIRTPGREKQWWPYVKFRGVCGAHGYIAMASFVDNEAMGGGNTPREALRSLAENLRELADNVEATLKDAP